MERLERQEERQEVMRALKDVDPFCALPDEALQRLCLRFERKVYSAGVPLLQQRESIERVGFIYAGMASVELKDVGGKDLRLGYLQDFDIFGETVVVNGGRSLMSAVCTEPCLCYVQKREDFLETLKSHPPVREFFLKAALNRLAQINLCLCGEKMLSIQIRNGKRPRIVRQAIEYIETYYAHPLNLDEVAKAAAVSRFYLSRLFREKTGFSFRQYLNFVRIQEAKRLLRDEDTSIVDIYDAVGFNSSSYFAKVFREQENVTPSEYRLTARARLFDQVTKADAEKRGAALHFEPERPPLCHPPTAVDLTESRIVTH
jgi:AraC-like DNA-binding protein